MAKKDTKDEQKAASGPAENKAAEPKTATTEEGQRRAEERRARKLSKAQQDRQKELAQSGYSVPDGWYADEDETREQDERIAKELPKTTDQEHKP